MRALRNALAENGCQTARKSAQQIMSRIEGWAKDDRINNSEDAITKRLLVITTTIQAATEMNRSFNVANVLTGGDPLMSHHSLKQMRDLIN